jgi:hypothetical protein
MRPGQVFGFIDSWWPHRRDAMVVLDERTEVSFWTGTQYRWGDIGPSLSFEVLA